MCSSDLLDKKLLDASPAAAVEAAKDELMHMGDIVRNMLRIVRQAYTERDIDPLMPRRAKFTMAAGLIKP